MAKFSPNSRRKFETEDFRGMEINQTVEAIKFILVSNLST